MLMYLLTAISFSPAKRRNRQGIACRMGTLRCATQMSARMMLQRYAVLGGSRMPVLGTFSASRCGAARNDGMTTVPDFALGAEGCKDAWNGIVPAGGDVA